MSTKGKTAKKTKLQRGDGGGTETFTTVAEVVSAGGPKRKQTVVDSTSFDSDAVERIGGIVDNGQVALKLNWVGSDPGQQGVITDMENSTLRNWKLIYNDHATNPTTWSFAALVESVDHNAASPTAKYEADVTLAISGTVTKSYPP